MLDVLELVKEYDVVTIFRHIAADPDAMGSQAAMKIWLQQQYPDKRIYALGESVGSCAIHFPCIDQVRDQDVSESCAIVLDTANTERIDDQRFLTAKCILKIDHHIVIDDYATHSFVNTKASATCEIVAQYFQQVGSPISTQCATYLYRGLMADSQGYTTSNTTSNTLRIGAYLMDFGVNVTMLHLERSNIEKVKYEYSTCIRNAITFQDHVAYAIMYKKDYEAFGFTYNQAKEFISVLANIEGYDIFALFSEVEHGVFNGSLRSKIKSIDLIANQFHGGGHAKACGVKDLSTDDITMLVQLLKQRIKEND